MPTSCSATELSEPIGETSRPGSLPSVRPALIESRGDRIGEALGRLSAPEPADDGPSDRQMQAAAAATAVPAPTAADRRVFPRRESGCVVVAHRLGPGGTVTEQDRDWLLHASALKGRLMDVSMNGAAFLLPQPVVQEERLLLRITNPRLGQSVDAAAHVLRTTEEEGATRVVCRFETNLTFEQIRQIGRAQFNSDVV
ncbi:MAG: PilZ domain-containing protein [Planctomycetaceae bacterium]